MINLPGGIFEVKNKFHPVKSSLFTNNVQYDFAPIFRT